MKLAAIVCATFFSGALLLSTASAQTPSPEPVKTPDASQLEALTKKIEEQNAKIDALSQEILKLAKGVEGFLYREASLKVLESTLVLLNDGRHASILFA